MWEAFGPFFNQIISHLGAFGLVVLTVNGVGCRHHTAAGVEASMDACLGDSHRLLLHNLQSNQHSSTCKLPSIRLRRKLAVSSKQNINLRKPAFSWYWNEQDRKHHGNCNGTIYQLELVAGLVTKVPKMVMFSA